MANTNRVRCPASLMCPERGIKGLERELGGGNGQGRSQEQSGVLGKNRVRNPKRRDFEQVSNLLQPRLPQDRKMISKPAQQANPITLLP